MIAITLVTFLLKFSLCCWPYVLVVFAGVFFFFYLRRFPKNATTISLRGVAVSVILSGLVFASSSCRSLFFLTLLSDEENDIVEWSAAHVDKYWDAVKILNCMEKLSACTIHFSQPEQDQALLFLSRLLSRKELSENEIRRFENLVRDLPDIHPTIYYEYGYSEGMRTFREQVPNGVIRGINVRDLHLYFSKNERAVGALIAPFQQKMLGFIEVGADVCATWSLRNCSTVSQTVILRPISKNSGLRTLYWCSKDDSLGIPNGSTFLEIASGEKLVTMPPKTVLWIKAEKPCNEEGMFTNIVIEAVSDGGTNHLSMCWEAG